MLYSWQVSPIVEQVRHDGDAAVRAFTSKLDKVELDDVCVSIQVRTNSGHPTICLLCCIGILCKFLPDSASKICSYWIS